MQLYAADPVRRVRQVLVDVVTVALIIVFVVLGRAVGASIAALGAVGQRVQEAGSGFRSTMSSAARRLEDLPFAGQAVGAPFRKASEAATTLADAGADQQAAAEHTALLVGIVVAVLPTLVLLVVWARRRGGFIRRAAEVRALLRTPLGVEALAAQALAHARASQLRDLDPAIADRWRAGERAAVEQLAAVALRGAGVPQRVLRGG